MPLVIVKLLSYLKKSHLCNIMEDMNYYNGYCMAASSIGNSLHTQWQKYWSKLTETSIIHWLTHLTMAAATPKRTVNVGGMGQRGPGVDTFCVGV